MKCPICDRNTKLTCIVSQMMNVEKHDFHIHDPNKKRAEFVCRDGHAFGLDFTQSCPVQGCEHSAEV
jgi:hypothetical protein